MKTIFKWFILAGIAYGVARWVSGQRTSAPAGPSSGRGVRKRRKKTTPRKPASPG